MNTKTHALALLGLTLLLPTALAAGDYYSGKSVYEPDDVGLLQTAPYTVDVYGGASALYNSNTTQLFNGTGAWMGVFDYGFDFKSRREGSLGGYYGLGYNGQAYWYENSRAAAGRDPLEHRVNGFFGLNGGKTRFRLNTDYYRNSGNSVDFESINREARSAQSNDFNIDATVARDLDHGSLEFGAGYYLRDFDAGTLLNDQNSYYGDVAWYFAPGSTPKTSYGLGFKFGSDDYNNNANQDFYIPSLRVRHAASAKTNLHGSVGWENRSRSSGIGGSADSFVFDFGANWRASDKTNLDFVVSRAVRPSYTGPNSDFTSTGFIVKATHDLPGQFVLGANVGYENANYFSTLPGAAIANLRKDNFLRTGVSVSHPLRISNDFGGTVTVFYNYNQNDSTIAVTEFDQSIAGVRFGFAY